MLRSETPSAWKSRNKSADSPDPPLSTALVFDRPSTSRIGRSTSRSAIGSASRRCKKLVSGSRAAVPVLTAQP